MQDPHRSRVDETSWPRTATPRIFRDPAQIHKSRNGATTRQQNKQPNIWCLFKPQGFCERRAADPRTPIGTNLPTASKKCFPSSLVDDGSVCIHEAGKEVPFLGLPWTRKTRVLLDFDLGSKWKLGQRPAFPGSWKIKAFLASMKANDIFPAFPLPPAPLAPGASHGAGLLGLQARPGGFFPKKCQAPFRCHALFLFSFSHPFSFRRCHFSASRRLPMCPRGLLVCPCRLRILLMTLNDLWELCFFVTGYLRSLPIVASARTLTFPDGRTPG